MKEKDINWVIAEHIAKAKRIDCWSTLHTDGEDTWISLHASVRRGSRAGKPYLYRLIDPWFTRSLDSQADNVWPLLIAAGFNIVFYGCSQGVNVGLMSQEDMIISFLSDSIADAAARCCAYFFLLNDNRLDLIEDLRKEE